MEKIPEQIKAKDLRKLYDPPINRGIPPVKIRKLTFEDRKVFESNCLKIARDSFSAFEKTLWPADKSWAKITVAEQVVDQHLPLSLAVVKHFITNLNGQRYTKLGFELKIPDKSDPIGEVGVAMEENTFNINHRNVAPQFREQGLAPLLLQCVEAFVKAKAADTQREQKIILNAAQIGVMTLAWNSGFRPQGPEDARRFEKVLEADANLCLEYDDYIFERKTPPGERNDSEKAYRITFELPISPGPDREIETARRHTKTALQTSVLS